LGWVALNSERSVITETVQTAIRGLFRDTDSHCLTGYSMNLRICSITRAELRVVVHTKVTDGLGVRVHESTGTTGLASHGPASAGGEREITHQHSFEVASLCELLDRNWMVKVEHVYREYNRATYYLACHSHSLPIGVILFSLLILLCLCTFYITCLG
ncbi:hypothetical protein LINGRAHAP2_LOCUS9085, partial [Linum grandiflorum]